MGKTDGFLTPKAIANRMKAKGLQKLRWYCEMCQKQCRDANGFKCHKMSEGHQRMMKVFTENSGRILDSFSREFESNFMNLVRTRWRTKRVFANKVYNEYISDKNHRHMNATVWQSLAGFVQHLGRTGQCIIDKTEKGWYIKYIDKDPEVLAKMSLIEQKEKMEVDDEIRGKKLLKEMYKNALTAQQTQLEPTELAKKDPDEKVVFKLADEKEKELKRPRLFDAEGESESEELKPTEPKRQKLEMSFKPITKSVPKPLSALDDIAAQIKKKQEIDDRRKEREEQERLAKEAAAKLEPPPPVEEEDDYWLFPNLVVKIVNQTVGGGKLFGKKGVVTKVLDLYVGIVQILDSDVIVKIDQAHLETVIPGIGNHVMIVSGAHKGELGLLESINVKTFKATISFEGGTIEKEYEEICKVQV